MKGLNSQYRYIRHGYWRRVFFWGSQSTSDLRIFRVRTLISDVKTPKTSTSASAVASMQLRITRLHKYPIDPKAYLGRCMNHALINTCIRVMSLNDHIKLMP